MNTNTVSKPPSIGLELGGSPVLVSQVFKVLAWIENIQQHKGISELKLRCDNTDGSFDLTVRFTDAKLEQQYQEFVKEYQSFRTQEVSPVFHLGKPFGLKNEDLREVEQKILKTKN